jgi:hypothetical protein
MAMSDDLEQIWKESFLRQANIATFALGKSSPVTGVEWPTGFQEVKVPRFHDNGIEWW